MAVNENGEEILCEAVTSHRRRIIMLILFNIMLVLSSMGLFIIIMPCIILVEYYIVKKWRLYLTHTDIHYQHGIGYTILPFSEITQISVKPGTNSILINQKSIVAYQNGVASSILTIYDVINCKEFVAAVKTEMGRN